MNRKVKRSLFKSKKRVVRYGLLVTNILLVIGIVSFIITTRNATPTTSAPILSLTQEKELSDPLDELSGADIAVNVAELVRMDQAVSVRNNADTVNSLQDVVPSSSQVVAKPQIVDTSLKSVKDLEEYTVVEGDTVDSIAAKFGITAQSVKWSNDITGNVVAVNKVLEIPPVNGIVYEVKADDTIEKIAEKYSANAAAVIAFNDAEIRGVTQGQKIVIPDGKVPAPVYTSNASLGGFAFGQSAVYGYNGYDYGWCTWWAAKRRADVGKPIPANFGNACNWIRAAQRADIPTGTTPQLHAVIYTNSACWGHVAFVEEMNEDGSIWVSDMNSRGQVSKEDPSPAGGWNRVSWRLVTPEQFGRFQFIY